jgi:hypothetical protein
MPKQNELVVRNGQISDNLFSSLLTDTERFAYAEWLDLQELPIDVSVAIKMYELFLNSYSLDEIYRVNGKKYHLGAIVDARKRHNWDARRVEQLDSMYSNIEDRILKVKNDAIANLADLLSAAHKVWGDKVKLFLQEGDPSLLSGIGLDPSNIKNYKEILAMLSSLVETKVSKNVQVGGTVQHVHMAIEPKKALNGKVAADLLKLVDDSGVIDG